MKLVFATHNQNKLKEVQALVPAGITLVSLKDIDCLEPIAETEPTLQGNAKLKADYITEHYNLPCFADDTGLMVNVLNGEPGVFSARYAGDQNDADANMDKVLRNLSDKKDRSASFKTVIALNLSNETMFFEGEIIGSILETKQGQKGFGYDPIFKPKGYERSFAELPLNIKNEISHRGIAFAKLIEYLNTL